MIFQFGEYLIRVLRKSEIFGIVPASDYAGPHLPSITQSQPLMEPHETRAWRVEFQNPQPGEVQN